MAPRTYFMPSTVFTGKVKATTGEFSSISTALGVAVRRRVVSAIAPADQILERSPRFCSRHHRILNAPEEDVE